MRMQLIEEIDPNETPDRVSRRFVTSDGRIFYARLEDEVVMICVVDAARPDWGKPNLFAKPSKTRNTPLRPG